jgi:hypothetical protein
MQEALNLFPGGAALEALCGWSDSLKSFSNASVNTLLFTRPWSSEFILHWSNWRRHHQALARYHHYHKSSQAP